MVCSARNTEEKEKARLARIAAREAREKAKRDARELRDSMRGYGAEKAARDRSKGVWSKDKDKAKGAEVLSRDISSEGIAAGAAEGDQWGKMPGRDDPDKSQGLGLVSKLDVSSGRPRTTDMAGGCP